MGAYFFGANQARLVCSNPITTAFPISVGAWIRLDNVGSINRVVWGCWDTGTTNHYFTLRMNSSEQMTILAAAGGTESTASIATALTADQWAYVVGRFIANNERRVSILKHDGVVDHAAGTVSRAPTNLDSWTLGIKLTSAGVAESWTGEMAEYWVTNTNVGTLASSNLDNNLLRQLAYRGPFSVPHVAANLIEYRSFFSSVRSDQDLGSEVYYGRLGKHTWDAINGVDPGMHPPLPPDYISLDQYRRSLVV